TADLYYSGSREHEYIPSFPTRRSSDLDTSQVISELDLRNSDTLLSVIVANRRGAELACEHEKIHFLGFPFSVSEKFQQYNTNARSEEHTSELQSRENLVCRLLLVK